MQSCRTWLLLASCLVAVCHTAVVQKQAPDALSYVPEYEENRGEVNAITDEERIKRSGGKQLAGYVGNRIKEGISSGLTHGITSIASGSVNKISGKSGILAKGDSHGRAYGHDHGYGYGHPHPPPHHEDPHESKKAEIWNFKKSIVSTLLQAVKALTGGVIGLSGKVTGVAGHVVEAKGRLLQTAGESIYGFGKHVSQKAFEQGHNHHHHVQPHHVPHPHYGAHVPTGYGASGHASAPAAPLFSSYGAPSGVSNEYGAPHYHVARAVKPAPAAHQKSDVKAGLLILKPIHVPSRHADYPQQSNNLNHAPSTGYDTYAPPPKAKSRSISQAEPPQQYQAFEAPQQQHGYSQLNHAPSMHYHTYATAPRTVQRSYNVAPRQYQASLGYELPSIDYEY